MTEGTANNPAPRLRWKLHWRLSVLWALEWGITGAILTYLPLYLTESGLTIAQLGELMAVSAVGLWVAPFVVGQVCDRWLASEKYLAIAHFIGGVTLYCIPMATRIYQKTGDNFGGLMFLFGLYAVVYFPTMPLASSLSFRHLPDPDAQFGRVRLWGTVGWVLAGLLLSVWLGQREALQWLLSRYPEWEPTLQSMQSWLPLLPHPSSSDCFRIAALLSFALSSFCVFLPSTPPARSRQGTVAPLETFRLFGDPQFRLLIVVSFLLAMVVPFYSLQVPRLLGQLGFDNDWIPAVMTVGQISEFPALLLLPFFLKRYGLKTTFALGMGAWMIRYSFFAFEGPMGLVFTGIALHGVCHVFLIIVIQLYVDSVCRHDLRASAQNLFAFLTMGIAMPIGFLVGGMLGEWCIDEQTGLTDYGTFFAIPSAYILVLLVFYWKRFQPTGQVQPVGAADESEAASMADDAHGFAGRP